VREFYITGMVDVPAPAAYAAVAPSPLDGTPADPDLYNSHSGNLGLCLLERTRE
jgi:hypothetical protein